MAVTGEMVGTVRFRKSFDQSLALVYYITAIAVLSFYGTRVCPFIDSLNSWVVVATFTVAFGAVLTVKMAFEDRLMPAADPFTLSVWQFFIDFGLFAFAGIAVSAWNSYFYQFPVESGLKVLIGCTTFGIFAGLDNGLRRERLTPPTEPRGSDAAQAIFPITRRLVVIFFGIAIFTGLVTALVLIKDIDFIIENVDSQPHSFLRRAVFLDIGFILLLVLALSLRLMWAYGHNLRYMLGLQLAGLVDVSRGRLDTFVPIVTRDEFSLIARKTNQMIDTLRRANEEQTELFEVSLAMATELELDQLLSMIAATTRGFVEAERVSLFLHDQRSNELWSKVAEGVDSQELRFPADHGIAGQVFISGKSLMVDDVYTHPEFNQDFDQRTGYRTRSILCVPITDRDGGTIGVIQALNKRSGTFTSADERRLRAFSAQASVALVNAQLFADLSRMKNYNESILRSLSNGVVTLDSDGRVVKVNEAALDILGEDEALVGRRLRDLLPPANRWLRHTSGDVVYWPDAEIARRDGGSCSANITWVPLADLDDHAIGLMLVLDDLTEEKRVRATLSRYVPHQVAERLLSDLDTNLGGSQQKVTVLFSDIRRFTTISEQIGARETVAMLNEYFGEMAEAIAHHDGVVDKYIGDAIMAAFGVPFPGTDDAARSVRASLEMLERLASLNQRRRQRGQDAINIGIGLSTGEAVLGNVGSARRMDYTVIGDTVNMAARIESATKTYGAHLIISEPTRRELDDSFELRELDRVNLRGKGEAVALFEVLEAQAASRHDWRDAYARGLASYRQGSFDHAVACFDEVLRITPDDGAARLLSARCTQLLATPPPEGWSGVWEMH